MMADIMTTVLESVSYSRVVFIIMRYFYSFLHDACPLKKKSSALRTTHCSDHTFILWGIAFAVQSVKHFSGLFVHIYFSWN